MNYALHLQLTELLACTMELQLLMAIPFYLAAHGLAGSQTRHQVKEQVTAQEGKVSVINVTFTRRYQFIFANVKRTGQKVNCRNLNVFREPGGTYLLIKGTTEYIKNICC
jgi:hypothetical protein